MAALSKLHYRRCFARRRGWEGFGCEAAWTRLDTLAGRFPWEFACFPWYSSNKPGPHWRIFHSGSSVVFSGASSKPVHCTLPRPFFVTRRTLSSSYFLDLGRGMALQSLRRSLGLSRCTSISRMNSGPLSDPTGFSFSDKMPSSTHP